MNELSPREPDDEGVASIRRAILKAFASAPLILTLMSGRARAEYFEGEYVIGSVPVCKDPGEGQEPPPPPPGCKQGQ